ncbi:MAG: hypothetical protein WBZ37_06010 [Mycobacterium sp.]
MARERSEKRMEALGDILSDGLNYEWFRVEALDAEAVTATLLVDTGDYNEETDQQIFKRVDVTADDVARGLRMYREYLEGKREMFPGEFKYHAKDAVRAGLIADEAQFDGPTHARARAEACGWETVKFDRTNGDQGDYDANTADSVMQFATIGQVMFG